MSSANLNEVDLTQTGVYIAYPTTVVAKPIYRGLKTQVNCAHTKVGITIASFAARKRDYLNTFGGEVEFLPIIAVPAERLAQVEREILLEMNARFARVGRATEWFNTADREAMRTVVLEVARRVLAGASDKDWRVMINAVSRGMRMTPDQLAAAVRHQ